VNQWDQLGLSVGQPGLGESLIPIWGSSRAAIDHFQNGKIGWGLLQTGLAITDVFLVKGIVTAAGKLGFAASLKFGGTFRAMIGPGNPFHITWRVGGNLLHANGPAFFRMEVSAAREGLERLAHGGISLPSLFPNLGTTVGNHAMSCVTGACSAWSRTNLHLPYFLGKLAVFQAEDDCYCTGKITWTPSGVGAHNFCYKCDDSSKPCRSGPISLKNSLNPMLFQGNNAYEGSYSLNAGKCGACPKGYKVIDLKF